MDMWTWTVNGPWIKGAEDTEYKYKVEDGTLYIAFQGSVSKIDWLQNFSFWKKPYKGMKKLWFAHAGFLKKWKAVEKDIMYILANAEHNGKVVVSGFSQGAAVALLCHEWIKFTTNYQVDTIVYGCPRVFALWGKIKDRFYTVQRFEVPSDIVTKVPPWWMLYKHVGHAYQAVKALYPWWRFKDNHMSYGRIDTWR